MNSNSIKIVLIGETETGKTSLLKSKNEIISPTIGLDFRNKQFKLSSGLEVRIQIVDTSGLEKFHPISVNHCRLAHGIILVYDISKRETFSELSSRYADIIKNSNFRKLEKVVIANKADLEHIRTVSTDEGNGFAKVIDAKYVEMSCREFLNNNTIESVLLGMAENISKKTNMKQWDEDLILEPLIKSDISKKRCCVLL